MTIRLILFAVLSLTAACTTDVHYGLANTPAGQENSNDATVQAIQRALDSADAQCAVRLIKREPTKTFALSGAPERVTVEVCGKNQDFDVRRIRMQDNRVMVTAKRH